MPLTVEQPTDLPDDRAQAGERGVDRDVVQALGELRTARGETEVNHRGGLRSGETITGAALA